MNIFNSLGSNYNLSYVLKSLSTLGRDRDSEKLGRLLEEKYGGKAILFYKGREALTHAIKTMGIADDSLIAINGFTCVAVFNAIRKAGNEPYCLDLEKTGGLNFTPKTLELALKSNKKIKAVVVQNTLGYPCDIERIEDICKKNNLILVEDLAHCIGTKYADGREAGTVGDFVILSFSQDKIIDAVSGGALVVRNIKYKAAKPKFKDPKNHWKDRLYPRFTFRIRLGYKFGLGKPYHFLIKHAGLLSNVLDESLYESYRLPNWNAAMTLYQFSLLEKQLAHRREIAEIYASNLPNKIFMYGKTKTNKDVSLSSNLRFPIFIENKRLDLVNFLKKNGIHVSDIWYTDVAPECPNAVNDSNMILNLPTHINVKKDDAKRITQLINQWIQK